MSSDTKSANKIIMATGVFDLMHPGHIYYLEQSKALGDKLVVVVTNDTVVTRTKGTPLFDEASRRHMVAALRCVDEAIIPTETEPDRYYQTVLDINPDIITLGYDQHFDEKELTADLAKHGWHGKIVRIERHPDHDVSSSQLKKKIKGENGGQV
jgi:FAD synthetase